MQQQFAVGSFRVDLYFTRHKIAVECDEHDHKDRDPHTQRHAAFDHAALADTQRAKLRFAPCQLRNLDMTNPRNGWLYIPQILQSG